MNVNVYGTKSKRLIEQLTAATELFAYRLMHCRMADNLDIDIEIDRTLSCQGVCINEDNTRRSRHFTIQLRNAPGDELIQTLAHEMVHLKQYAKNEHVTVKNRTGTENIWMGKPWRARKNENIHYDAPWEVDAYGREVGLMAHWVSHKQTV
jgi:hypothetical protein